MTTCEFKIPTRHLEILRFPEWKDFGHVLADNIERLSKAKTTLFNRPLHRLRSECRQELLETACQYSAAQNLPIPDNLLDRPLIVAGHQSVFFHCGILSKYILANHLTRVFKGKMLNLLVDHDLPKAVELVIPVNSGSEFQENHIPFAQVNPLLPMEYQSPVSNNELKKFVKRLQALPVSATLRDRIDLIIEHLLKSFDRIQNPGQLVMLLNHRLAETLLGIYWMDLPVSLISRSRSFSFFSADLIIQANRVRAVYNEALSIYRHEHKIKNPLQPMPDLRGGRCPDDMQETLFWVFRDRQPRRPLFIRSTSEHLVLSDSNNDIAQLPYRPGVEHEDFVAFLQKAQDTHRFSLRPRAIALTLFARIFLSDYFIHGVGGARYDAIADRLMEALYDTSPPGFAVASAGCFLNSQTLPDPESIRATMRTLDQQLRDIQYRPKQCLDTFSDELADNQRDVVEQYLQQKQLLIQRSQSSSTQKGSEEDHRLNFMLIHQINDKITTALAPVKKLLENKKADLQRQLNQALQRHNRERFFGLFDRPTLNTLQQKFDISE